MLPSNFPNGEALPQTASAPRADWPRLLGPAILAVGCFAIYRHTFLVPLLLDDGASIRDNATLHHLWPVWPALAPPINAGVGGRPFLNLSFALNYAVGGTAVFGYHLVNLVIHILAAWTLFGVVRRTLTYPIMAERFAAASSVLALTASAIWAWHPLQTESVTYLSQRAESMMGLFYFLTLYCFLRGAELDEKRGGRLWFSLSVLACLAGVGTKEVIVTAPLLVFLYDRTFISGSFTGAWRRHAPLYLALAATWIPLGFLMIDLPRRGVGAGLGVAWWVYGFTECRVVMRYLILAIWPRPLIFDYGMYVPATLSELWPWAVVLAGLLSAAAVALRRAPAAGFASCWFFLILAPASSVIPIVEQPMAENRLYLPLAGVAAFAVIGAFAWVGRRSLPLFAFIAASLGCSSAQRNQDYASVPKIWNDTIEKNPSNPRSHNNLGDYWLAQPGRSQEAISEYQEALRLKPDYSEAHNNLGTALNAQGKTAEATFQFQEALRFQPNNAEAHFNLGNAWSKSPGRVQEAITQYEAALRLKPDYAEADSNLGSALLKVPGRSEEAIVHFERALRLKPDLAAAHNNLGNALSQKAGRMSDAIIQYAAALQLRPDIPEIYNNLASALNAAGRIGEAIAQYESALSLQTDNIRAHLGLGAILMDQPGRVDEARAHLEAVLKLQPGNEDALRSLAKLRHTHP